MKTLMILPALLKVAATKFNLALSTGGFAAYSNFTTAENLTNYLIEVTHDDEKVTVMYKTSNGLFVMSFTWDAKNSDIVMRHIPDDTDITDNLADAGSIIGKIVIPVATHQCQPNCNHNQEEKKDGQ